MKKLLTLLLSLFLTICNSGFVYAEDNFAKQEEQIIIEEEDLLPNPDDDVVTPLIISDEISDTGYLGVSINNNDFIVESSVKNASALDSNYSLVDEGKVTKVKNQANFGTCWAHAICATSESSMIVDNEEDTNIDLSELQLAFYTYHSGGIADPLDLITESKNSFANVDGEKDFLQGGSAYLAQYTLASGLGLITEDKLSYQLVINYDEDTLTRTYLNKYLKDEYCYYNDYYLVESKNFSPNQVDLIKQELVKNGAISISYYHNSSYYNSTKGSYYYNGSSSSNHAVTLVGWDDNYSRDNFKSTCRPSKNGAWLVRNSWDDDWGNNGYFWLSYEDASFNDDDNDIVQFDVDKNDGNTYIYQYDGTFNIYTFNYGSSVSRQIGNIYTAQNDELLTKVGFFTQNANAGYTVNIYKGCTSSPTTGTLISSATVSGSLDYAGYHTVELKEPVELSEGEKFSVVIKYTNVTSLPIECDYNGTYYKCSNTYVSGRSFYRSSDSYSWTDAATQQDGYMRVKAYTSRVIEEETYNITYDLDGGTLASANPSTYTNLTPSFTLNNPTKEGYEFIGWTSNKTSEPQLSMTVKRGTTGDLSFKANYAQIYTIKYELDGGTLAKQNPSTYTQNTADFTLNNPTKDGKTFIGWTYAGVSEPQKSVTVKKGTTGNLSFKANYADYVVLETGSCGTNATYTIYSDYSMVISGTGAIKDYSSSTRISSNYYKDVKSVTIEDGITKIGKYAFSSYSNLASIDIPDSVSTISNYAFKGCTSLSKIFISSKTTTISASSYKYSPFYNCSSSLVIYTDASSKLSGWGKYWNYYSSKNTLSVVYKTSRESFDSMTKLIVTPTTINVPLKDGYDTYSIHTDAFGSYDKTQTTNKFTGLYPDTEYTVTYKGSGKQDVVQTVKTKDVESYTEGEYIDSSALKFDGAYSCGHALDLGSSLSINYRFNPSRFEGYDLLGLYVKKETYDKNNNRYYKVSVVKGSYSKTDDRYFYFFNDIAAKNMTDAVYSTLYLEKNGNIYITPVDKYTVVKYALSILNQPTYSKLFDTIVDMIKYGSLAQEYFNYNTDDLASSYLTEEQLKLGFNGDLNLQNHKINNPNGEKIVQKGNTLDLGNNVALSFTMLFDESVVPNNTTYFHYEYTNQEGILISRNIPITSSNYNSSTNRYIVFVDDISIRNLNKPVTAYVSHNGEVASNIKQYSVETYAYDVSKMVDQDKLRILTESLMKFSRSTEIYFSK